MIAYDLCCSSGHTFEGWFEDSASFDAQMQKGLITCPVCEDSDIKKILSPVSIRKSFRPSQGQGPMASLEESVKVLERIGTQIREFVEKNFDDVGPDFAKEALKIHYGVAEPRNIRGVSTESDEEMLKKEGIAFFKLPGNDEPETETDS